METVKHRRAAVRAAFPATVPVMTGFLTLSIAYGILMRTNGYGPLWSTLMSAIGFGGSMQYVAITLLVTAFDPLQAFLLALLVNAGRLCYGLSLLDYLYWVGGTAWGGLLGRFITFDTTVLDFALTALFVVLFLEQWKKPENRPSGLIGIGCAAVSLAVFGPDKLVIPAMALILAVLLGGRKRLCI